ncbi:flagellar M-ring protein FliF [Oleiharenicola lentus]|jgi:flagellar M-ring protein FliF|uniref:Flagellar M-ring protein n=1 Tax=Oleiharenicola lentus TaxID=2508720 RepID=A0A4Q1C3P6_9BACT|nr:flagellar basal-body MS-ring/collar protein FliF [Oleiharenicola lentus]RXK52972.1 flagellar M-ring protein FliF [Oleiharenicola lentus]
MKKFAQSLLDLWSQLGLNQRVSLIVAAVAVIGGMIAVVLWSRRPDYQLLYARLGDKDSSAVISYLQSQNIPHQISAGGGTVSVPAERVHKLRMDLAAKGLPSGEGVGFEIFDKGQFGLSDFVQRTNYLRALQGELARTISQLSGVRAARVMIVQPENRLLLTDNGIKPTASVFVDMGGGRLEVDQVNAIRHLVANAVQGLGPDQVAVVDNRGRVLSEDLKQDPTLGTASSQMRYKQQVEDYLSKKVETMLAQVIGPGNAVVRVSADIETEATTISAEVYDPEGQVVRSQTSTEDVNTSSETRSGGGAVGVSANVPEKAATTEGAANRPVSNSEQNRKNRTTTYEINRTLTNTTRNPGTIKNVTAAVLVAQRQPVAPAAATPPAEGAPAPQAVPQPRTAEELATLRAVVVNALGLKPEPGQPLDTIVTLTEVPFAAEPVSEQLQAIHAENKWQGWIEAGSRWSAVGGAALVLLIFLRMLSRQKPEPVPVEVLQMPPEMAARSLQNGSAVTPEMLNELIKQKPVNIGTALRDWVGTPAASKNN